MILLTQTASSSQNDLLCKKSVVKEEHLIFPIPNVNSIGLNRGIVSLHVYNKLNQTVIVKVTPYCPSGEVKMIENPDSNITIDPMRGKTITYSLRFLKAGNYNLFGDTIEIYSTDGTLIKKVVTNDSQITIELYNLPWIAFLISLSLHLSIVLGAVLGACGFGLIAWVAAKIACITRRISPESMLLIILVVLVLISIIYNLKIFRG
jgi:hypothetical protein